MCLAVVGPSAGSAIAAYPTAGDFADWVAVDGSPAVATGTLNGSSISISGTHVFPPPVSVLDGHWTFFSGPDFSPALERTDVIQVGASSPAESYTLTFGSPVTDPVIEIGSLGSRLDFANGTQITKIAGQSGFTVSGSSVIGTPSSTLGPDGINDSNGTVQLAGTFTSILFTALYTVGSEDGVILQVGASPPPPPPSPPPPAPTTTPAPGRSPARVASFTSGATAASPGLAILDAQASSNVSSLGWDVNGDGHIDVTCPAATPIVGLRGLGSGTRTVTLTAFGLTGASSSASRQLLMTAGVQAAVFKAGPQMAICGPTIQAVHGIVVQHALAPPPCFTPSVVTFGIVEAKGCFEHVLDGDGVPAPERPVVTEYYDEAKLPVTAQIICDRDPASQACADDRTRYLALDLFVSRQPVSINGLTFAPRGNGSIVLFPGLQRVVSSDAVVSIGRVQVDAGAIDFDLHSQVKSLSRVLVGRAPLLDFDAAGDLLSIGGFALDGQVHLDFVQNGAHRYTEATLHLALPSVFDAFGGAPPSGAVTAVADNTTHGLVLDRLHFAVPAADLGGLRFTNVAFDYSASGNGADCGSHWWKATANVFLGSTGKDAGFILSPPPSQNGIAFCDGGFKSAGGAVMFGAEIPPPQLFPGVSLQEIDFAIGLHPTLVRGGVEITVADIGDVHGTVLLGFPSTTDPYVLTPQDAANPGHPGNPGDLAPLAGRRLTSAFVAAGGSVGVDLTVLGRIPFGNGYFLISPHEIALGGHATISVPGMSIDGGIDGDWILGTDRFNLHGVIEGCVAGLPVFCPSVEAWVSTNGMAVCFGDIRHEGWHPGAGYHWGDAWPTIWLGFPFGNCKPSHYWLVLSARDARAASSATVTVAPEETLKDIRVKGLGGAPSVEVRGPGGQTISTATSTYVTNRTFAILRQNEGDVTWIGIAHGHPGRYTITPLPGSPPIAGIASTRSGSQRITAVVSGNGSHRTVRYTIGSPAGKEVTLFERGPSVYKRIGSTRGSHGTMHLSPAPGPGGTRQIIAQITVDGVPAPSLIVGRYRAPNPPRMVKPANLRVTRRGTTLLISWRSVSGASAYGVMIKQRSAGERLITVSARRHSIRVTDIGTSQNGVVFVSAHGQQAWGQGAATRFATTTKPHTVLRPFKLLGKPRSGL